jgi:hypothetical protein
MWGLYRGYENDSLHSLDLQDSGELKGVMCKLPLHLSPSVQNRGHGSSCLAALADGGSDDSDGEDLS